MANSITNTKWGLFVIMVAAVASMATSKVEDDPPPSGADAGLVAPDASAAESYAAYAVVGALDRIRIVKMDWANDVCYGIGLVSPTMQGSFGITVPAGWDVEFAYGALGADSCGDQVPADPIWGISGTGTVRFDVGGAIYPTVLTVDARVVFNDERLPVRIDVEAVDLPIQGL